MSKNVCGFVLTCLGLVVIIFAIVLFGVSGSLIDDLDDTIVAGYIGDVDVSTGFVKELLSRGAESENCSVTELLNTGAANHSFTDDLRTVNSNWPKLADRGFAVFALYGRGWFMAGGILLILAAVIVVAYNKDPKLFSETGKWGKRVGLAVGGGVVGMVKAIFCGNRGGRARVIGVCPKCGVPFTGVSSFCANCGAKLPDLASLGVCKTCGTRNEPGARFCSGCGQPLQ